MLEGHNCSLISCNRSIDLGCKLSSGEGGSQPREQGAKVNVILGAINRAKQGALLQQLEAECCMEPTWSTTQQRRCAELLVQDQVWRQLGPQSAMC